MPSRFIPMSERQQEMLEKLRKVSSEERPYLAKNASESGTILSLIRRRLLENTLVESVSDHGTRCLRRGVWVKEGV